MCGFEIEEREKRGRKSVCFGHTGINRRTTTDGRHTRHPLLFCNPFFKLFVYKSVCLMYVFCDVCMFVRPCLCLFILYALFCMIVHDHVNIMYACTFLFFCFHVCLFVNCLILYQLPVLDSWGLFAFLWD